MFFLVSRHGSGGWAGVKSCFTLSPSSSAVSFSSPAAKMTTARYRPTWELAVDPLISCKLCLGEFPLEQMTTITQCQCVFCTLVSHSTGKTCVLTFYLFVVFILIVIFGNKASIFSMQKVNNSIFLHYFYIVGGSFKSKAKFAVFVKKARFFSVVVILYFSNRSWSGSTSNQTNVLLVPLPSSSA